jgi:hypothetical protein
MPVLDEGLEAAEKAAEEAKNSAFHRVGFLKIEDGKSLCLRFVSPRTLTLGIHAGIETKKQPKEVKGDKWPKRMWGICQNDKAFRLRDGNGTITDEFEPEYGDCHIHSKMRGIKDEKYGTDKSQARVQTFGLAVVREPVRDPVTEEIVGFRDVTEEFKDGEGVSHQIPKIVLVQQTYSNFWAPLKASMFMGPKTICGWDFSVSRKENDYTFGANATPDFQPGTDGWKRYDETLALLGLDLGDMLLEWASPDWYARWFIEGATPKDGYGRKDDDESAEGGEATPDDSAEQVDQATVDAMRLKLQGARSGAASTASTETPS